MSIRVSLASAGALCMFLLAFLFALPVQAQVTPPSVTTVSVTPSSGPSVTLRNLGYSATESFGSTLLFTCPAGVTVKRDNGTVFPCGSRVGIGGAGSDSLGISVINISGTTQPVSVRVYPRDRNGADYDAGSLSTTFSVGTVQNPVSDLSLSTATLPSGESLTITWGSSYLSNVNLRFDCTGLTIVPQGSTTAIPCGAIAYASDLAGSGSQTVSVTNPSNTSATLSVTALPVITTGQYDGLNSKTVIITVLGRTVAQDPTLTLFTSSASFMNSAATTTFTILAQNAQGVNLRFSCVDDISAYDANGNRLPCERAAFASSTTASTTAVRFVNQGTMTRIVAASVILGRRDGSTFIVPGRDIQLTVQAPGAPSVTSVPLSPIGGMVVTATPTTTTATQTVPTTPGSLTLAPSSGSAHAPITVDLKQGMRHAQVTVLQTFLAQDKAIYPEGTILGYFGPATEAAVKRFQIRHGIAKQGTLGYGRVGPATRAKINVLTRP